MTPPIFNLGDEVKSKDGMQFEISQIQKNSDGSISYSTFACPHYHASELKLVNKAPLSPMWLTYNYKPDAYEHGTIQVSCPCGRKAEIAVPAELKIGDWVQVIQSAVSRGFNEPPDPEVGKIFQIKEPRCDGIYFRTEDTEREYWPFACLRKLTPDGIADRTAPNLELSQEMKVKIGMTFLKHLDQIGELQDRLKQHDEEIKGIYDILENHEEIHEGMDERLSTIEKRLAFVEKIQRDQDDLVGRAIRDGVAEIFDFRRKA